MSIGVESVVQEQPYGNPGSLGEPLGLWMGNVIIAGDASGSPVELLYVPQNPLDTPGSEDKRVQHVYFTDGASSRVVGSTSPGDLVVSYDTHWAPTDVTIPQQFLYRFISRSQALGTFHEPLDQIYADYVARMPQFWEASQLGLVSQSALAQFRWEVNALGNSYEAKVYGRYYDRQVLGNRAFGRLVSPPAISQFSG